MLKDGNIVFDGAVNEAMGSDMLWKVYDFDVASYIKDK
jgi:ABC-type cobalamin/Fe3+-siderophores transport system ATPase subunit